MYSMMISVFFMLTLAVLLLFLPSSDAATSQQHLIQCLYYVSEVIYTPQNSTYTSVLKFSINNLRFDTPSAPKPLVIVKPVHESQIQTVIHCSKKHDYQMRIRGGGHDFEGLSYVSQVPYLLLDMINFRSVDVDVVAATAWVQSGATLGELYYSIAQKSNTLAFPGGVWSTVGVTGLISGGGYGNLRRKYGLAADNVLDARLIDANGMILDRKSMGEDLFWAIRGGGASSFGVVLSWKLNLVYVPEIVTVFQVERTLEQNATQLLHKWQTVAPKLPKDVEMRVIAHTLWKNRPNEDMKTVQDIDSRNLQHNKTVSLKFTGLFLGQQYELLSLMNQKFPELGLVAQQCIEVTYIQSVLMFSLFSPENSPTVLTNRTAHKIAFKAKSDFVANPIPRQGLDGLLKLLLNAEPGQTNFIFTSYGGRMNEISESATPFPHRAGTLYMTYMRVRTDGDTTNAMKWIRGLYKYLTPYVTKSPRSAYRNYNDLDLGKNNHHGATSYKRASIWGKKYFKNNFDRLVIVKSIADPHNFFRHEQSIPPFA